MRILITGAGGNIGSGLVPRLERAGHRLVLADLSEPRWVGARDFRRVDVTQPFDEAAAGCDLIVHLPAWHGIHLDSRSEADFWRLNVDGTFWALQATRANGIRRFLYLSSQAWHEHYGVYGFTKRIGEELLAYHHEQHDLSYVAVRPNALTPWASDWAQEYGWRMLYSGVDREDVLDAIELSIAHLATAESASLIVDAMHPNAFTEEQLADWELDPLAAVERIFPGAREVVERFGLDITERPPMTSSAGWREIGFSPRRHFGTFVAEAAGLSVEQARNRASDY